MDDIDFSKSDYRILVEMHKDMENMKAYITGADARIKNLEEQVVIQGRLINHIKVKASAIVIVAGTFFYVVYEVGAWLAKATNLQALKTFINSIDR